MRVEFAVLLGNFIARDYPIIYVDETTFNSWSTKSKSWCLKGQPNKHQRNNKYHSTTVYGGIGDCLEHPVYLLGTSTEQKQFRVFLRNLKMAVRARYSHQRQVIILDNHSSHKTTATLKLLNSLFIPVFMPPHSSPCNSIETVWSCAKRNFLTLMLQQDQEVNKREFEQLVLKACEMINAEAVHNMTRANREYILQHLSSGDVRQPFHCPRPGRQSMP